MRSKFRTSRHRLIFAIYNARQVYGWLHDKRGLRDSKGLCDVAYIIGYREDLGRYRDISVEHLLRTTEFLNVKYKRRFTECSKTRVKATFLESKRRYMSAVL